MKKFDRVSKHYDKFIDTFNLNKMDEIREIMNLKGNEIVVDLGGGTGRLAEYIAESCGHLYILDESQSMLSQVKANSRVKPILGDALNLDFPSNSIDIVVICDLIHHIKMQERLIEEIHRVLKNGGRLIVLDFNIKHIKVKLLKVFETLLFGKLYFKSDKEVIRLIESKFEILSFNDRGYYFIIEGEKDDK